MLSLSRVELTRGSEVTTFTRENINITIKRLIYQNEYDIGVFPIPLDSTDSDDFVMNENWLDVGLMHIQYSVLIRGAKKQKQP